MIRTATHDDRSAIHELLVNANDAPYDLSAVAEEKCFGDGIAGPPQPRVFESDGRLLGIAVTCGKWLRILAVARDARRRGIGSALLADSNATVIAAEAGNYFTPGIWIDDNASRAFFSARGFVETHTTWNLHADLSSLRRVGDSATRTAATPRVLDFVEREFGRIWRFEALRAEAIYIAEDEGEIAAFAAIEANNRGLGTFGPAGTAKHMRGRGLGASVAVAALTGLRERGYARAIIPWTDAHDFYRKCCGAEPAHRFVAFAKPQP